MWLAHQAHNHSHLTSNAVVGRGWTLVSKVQMSQRPGIVGHSSMSKSNRIIQSRSFGVVGSQTRSPTPRRLRPQRSTFRNNLTTRNHPHGRAYVQTTQLTLSRSSPSRLTSKNNHSIPGRLYLTSLRFLSGRLFVLLSRAKSNLDIRDQSLGSHLDPHRSARKSSAISSPDKNNLGSRFGQGLRSKLVSQPIQNSVSV